MHTALEDTSDRKVLQDLLTRIKLGPCLSFTTKGSSLWTQIFGPFCIKVAGIKLEGGKEEDVHES